MKRTLPKIGIILLASTAIFNLMGGFGTSCAAFFTSIFDSMKPLTDYRFLYQLFVITTIPLGFAGLQVKKHLTSGNPKAYKEILVVLLLGTIVGGAHMYTSQMILGKAAPANIKFYLNIITLVYFLIIRIPVIWNKLDFIKPNENSTNCKKGICCF